MSKMTMDFSFSSHTPIDGIFGETRISAIIYSFVIVLAIVPVCIWYTIAEGTAGNRAISYLISVRTSRHRLESMYINVSL